MFKKLLIITILLAVAALSLPVSSVSAQSTVAILD